MIKLTLISIFLIFPSLSYPKTGKIMNGFKLNDFKDFEQQWNFVTARYRKDSTEIRFTYANDLAIKALKQNSTDYPDGSIFGKYSVHTKPDIDFPSSMVPRGVRRFQFMVRDKEKFKKTGGWGYALFDDKGDVFPGDLNTKSLACAACHQIVKAKGQVFSEPMAFLSAHKQRKTENPLWKKSLKFQDIEYSKAPPKVKAIIPAKFQTIRNLTGAIKDHLFSGSLDELRPLLIQETLASNQPSIITSRDNTLFLAVVPSKHLECSGEGKTSLLAAHTLPGKDRKIYKIQICENKQ